jgi:hypothetical protein
MEVCGFRAVKSALQKSRAREDAHHRWTGQLATAAGAKRAHDTQVARIGGV